MRHNKAINHLGRKSGHRKALLANMAASLILNKRIQPTVAKAKALQSYVEPLITKSKDDSTASRRTVFSYLRTRRLLQSSSALLLRRFQSVRADTPEYSRQDSVRATVQIWLLSSSLTSMRQLSLQL